MKRTIIISMLTVVAVVITAKATMTLQYDTWTQSNPVINTGSTGTSGTQVTPGDATIVSGPDAPGISPALHMSTANAQNDYINSNLLTGPGGVDIQGHSFTAAAWVNLDAGGASGDHMVFGTSYPGGNNTGLHLGFRNGQALFGTFNNDSQGSSVTPGQWNYWIWRYDSTVNGGEQDIFKDGVLVVSGTNKGAFASDLPLTIGASQSVGGANLGGSLDDVRIFNTALSNSEVTQLNALVRQSDPVPEPSTLLLIGLGLAGLYTGFKRTKK